MTPKRLTLIREWFARHQDDYDPHSRSGPPKVWADYFRDLLRDAIARLEAQEEEQKD